jgi:hypothetical protein
MEKEGGDVRIDHVVDRLGAWQQIKAMHER